MTRLKIPNFFVAVMCLYVIIIPHADRQINVWLIGDSTVCEYSIDRAPLTGWGMPFSSFFDSSVMIHNHAKGGRSTKTFISEERWKKVFDRLQAGDYVFIQFGHNDEATEEKYKDRYTPVSDYKANLEKFISDARNKHALPVLLTPVTRRRFDTTGQALDTHLEYSNAVRETGTMLNVPVIDLDSRSKSLIQEMGSENSKLLFMHLEPREHPNYPAGIKDNTHFTEYGARRMAELVLEEIRSLNLGLARNIYSKSSVNQ